MDGDDTAFGDGAADPDAAAQFAFGAQEQQAQGSSQAQAAFTQGRNLRGYIRAVSKGGNPSRGAIRTGLTGPIE